MACPRSLGLAGRSAIGGDLFFNRGSVVEVPHLLRKQKHLLVGFRRPVLDALWSRVRLLPDDLRAQVPAVGAQRERNHPWNTDEFLRLGFRWRTAAGMALI